MKQVKIQNLAPNLVSGVTVQVPGTVSSYQETFFEWTGSSLLACFKTPEISGGVLRTWHHVPVFSEVEFHVDAEMFYFISGTALMLFIDLAEEQPVPSTAQVVRIQAGTQIVISAGKAHFVAVAETDAPVEIIVVSPRMPAPRLTLPEPIKGTE